MKTTKNASRALVALALVFSAVALPLAADSTIYRCGPEGSQRFSQIPCEENSEQVIVVDHVMFKETGASGDSADSMNAEQTPTGQASAASNAQAFITQLEKQRDEQIAEIDRNIEELQSRAKNGYEADGLTGDAEVTANLLASMQNTRQSIMSEYEAMITAARERIETP